MHLLSFLFFASVRRRCAAPLHRNRTSPPSLWPGRELRKYHCPQHLSSPPPGAARLLSCKLYRSLISEVVAHSRKRLRGSAHSVGNVPDACMFGFQGSLSGKALRKQICRVSCGENPLTIRWVCFRILGHFYFPSHLSMDIFPPVVRYRPEYIFAAEGRGAAGQKRCPLTFQWTFF